MLDHYYLRPKTADRIRALWLGPAIEQYAAWASERGAAKATVAAHLQALIQFDRFAQSHGATTWTDLPALLEPFVEHWMQAHGTRCTGDRARQSRRSHARTPIRAKRPGTGLPWPPVIASGPRSIHHWGATTC